MKSGSSMTSRTSVKSRMSMKVRKIHEAPHSSFIDHNFGPQYSAQNARVSRTWAEGGCVWSTTLCLPCFRESTADGALEHTRTCNATERLWLTFSFSPHENIIIML